MNAMNFLTPYMYEGMWVFDDPDVGLIKEPFVSGIDDMLTAMTASIPDAEKGFTLIYSAAPFPGHTLHLEWRREEYGGNWYHCAEYGYDGWLCPALFKYFDKAPEHLYAMAKSKAA